MTDDPAGGDAAKALRARAEKVAITRRAAVDPGALSTEDASRLIHELQVHQIELEQQNEELRRTQAQLEASRLKYFDLYALAPIGYCTISDEGAIVDSNLTLAKMLSVDRSELIQRPFTRLIDPGDQDVYYHLLQRLKSQDRPQIEELRMRRGEEQFWTRLEVVARRDDEGHRTLRVAVSDINDFKIAHQALAKADRAANLGILAAGLAHEINNPLAYLQLNIAELDRSIPVLAAAADRCATHLRATVGLPKFMEIAQDGGELLSASGLAALVEHAKASLDGVQRITALSKALLAFNRVENLAPKTIDLDAAIDRSLLGLEGSSQVAIVHDSGPSGSIKGSVGRVDQLLSILLTRAIDASIDGAKRISIRTWKEEQEVCVEITDSGPKPTAESLERFFEPVFSVDPGERRLGLFLAIGKSIVAELGGRIAVEAGRTGGVAILLRLPSSIAANAAPIASAVAAQPPVRGRVLLVDDEEVLLVTMTRVLGRQHEVVAVQSGSLAKALLEKDLGFDGIVCDLMMPEMSGLQLHAWLWTQDPRLAERILFVTGGSFLAGSVPYLDALPNPRLEKPFSPEALRSLVAELVGASRKK